MDFFPFSGLESLISLDTMVYHLSKAVNKKKYDSISVQYISFKENALYITVVGDSVTILSLRVLTCSPVLEEFTINNYVNRCYKPFK